VLELSFAYQKFNQTTKLTYPVAV